MMDWTGTQCPYGFLPDRVHLVCTCRDVCGTLIAEHARWGYRSRGLSARGEAQIAQLTKRKRLWTFNDILAKLKLPSRHFVSLGFPKRSLLLRRYHES